MTSDTEDDAPHLNRVLGLRELVLYGIVLIQPTAPMPLYGVVATQARGHVVTTILIGMVAMLFTAASYGRMAGALYIWCSLRTPAKLAGMAWLVAGLVYGAWKTRGFRHPKMFSELGE